MTSPEPAEGWARPPWEEFGYARCDCLPHRGPILFAAGAACTLCGLFALCLPLVSFLGVPLGLVALLVSRHDLQQIRRSLIDPEGEELTTDAVILSSSGLTLCLVGVLLLCVRLWMDLDGL